LNLNESHVGKTTGERAE